MLYYKGVKLHRNSHSYELYLNVQKATTDTAKKAAQKALDDHMKQLDVNELNLLNRYK